MRSNTPAMPSRSAVQRHQDRELAPYCSTLFLLPRLLFSYSGPNACSNHEFNVFLSGANENDGGDDVGGTEDTGSSSKGADGIAEGGLADGGPRRRGSSTAGLASPTSEPDARRSPGRKSPTPSPRGRDVSRLLTERPAVVEEVLHEDVVSGFNCSGSNQGFGVVGCVVASISREPFQDTEASPKVP